MKAMETKAYLVRRRTDVNKLLAKLPEGKLKCHKSAGIFKWYKVERTNEGG